MLYNSRTANHVCLLINFNIKLFIVLFIPDSNICKIVLLHCLVYCPYLFISCAWKTN